MSVVINASNLHVGGGVQVAASFISELYKLQRFDFSIVCSTSVFQSLPDSLITNKFFNFHVLDIFGFQGLNVAEKKIFDGYNVCFTVFGPFYPRIKVQHHICGFAQPWIAYPNNEAYLQLSVLARWKTKLKFWFQKQYFKTYDQLVVEQNHIKNALSIIGFDQNKINVVSNCVSSIYLNHNEWLPIGEPFPDNGKAILGFLGRGYPHKNLKILTQVNDALVSIHNLNINFVFSLTNSEMSDLMFDKIGNFYSVGSLSAQQCPDFYSKIDALIFPSLLECYSASPIEAMKMGKPVIASDRDFITDVCGEAGIYFDPLDPIDIAEKIVRTFSNHSFKDEKIRIGSSLAQNLSMADDRAINYVHIIEDALKNLTDNRVN